MSELRELLRDAHQRAARDNANLSSQLVVAMAQAGAPFEKACASALLSLGTLHAPVTEARRLFRRARYEVRLIPTIIRDGYQVVPGLGNSFYKDRVDPAFVNLHYAVKDRDIRFHEWFHACGTAFQENAKRLPPPNAAFYTALVAEIEGVAEGTELALVVEARLPVWAELWAEHRPRKELWRG